MADVIKCPVCGENNRPGQEFCQNCQSQLLPASGSSKGGDEILKPGQAPTKKNTADLEPILPQWLRDARDSARNITTDAQPEPPAQKPQPASPVDFLAGLHSQAEDGDEEDVPDWLTNITGETPKPKKSQSESSSGRRVEMGEKKDFAQEEPAADSDTPSWLAGLAPTSQPDEKDDLTDWFRDASGIQKPQAQPQQPASSDNDSPDWLRAMAAEDDAKNFNTPSNESDDIFGAPSTSSDTPDWLRSMAANSDAQQADNVPADNNDLFGSSSASDTPDWLRSMAADGGTQPSNIPADNNDLFGSASSSDTPDWLRSMAADSGAQNSAIPAKDDDLFGSASSSDTPDWLRSMAADGGTQPSNIPADNNDLFGSSSSSDTPDWLRSMASDSGAQNSTIPAKDDDLFGSASSSDTPDWLRSMASDSGAQASNVPAKDDDLFGSASSSDTPDWLRSMASDSGAQGSTIPAKEDDLFGSASSSDTPDWLSGIQSQSAEPASFSEPVSGGVPEASNDLFQSDVPDWLKGVEPEKPASTSSDEPDWLTGVQKTAETPVQNETPTWAELGATSGDELELPSWLSGAKAQEPAAPVQDDALGDVPSWLKASAPQASMQEAPAPADPVAAPDWLGSLKSDETPVSSSNPPAGSKADFVDNSSGDMDKLFTDLPDWLSNADDAPFQSSAPAPITNTDAIAPGELPSWVQAMRPVDSSIPASSSGSFSSDKTLESRGALAGLQGVLPAVPGFSPASKPKAYSIRLQPSDEQQAHAALLEQILAGETAPVPISSYSTLKHSRGLRWFLFALFFVALPVILALRTQIFALPVSLPSPAVQGALNVAQLLPEGAPVLVAFDFEPARAGEMEAVAAPMFDQMLLLHHPRFTFISTNESGPILAERFITTGPLAGHQYQSGIEYLNLGYLPGGQMGIYAFAQEPTRVAPYAFSGGSSANMFDFSLTPAWTAEPWNNITSLSQFTAFIIVTDNADSARAWIEQTTSTRGTISVVVISSAQAAPMIRPYFDSQQISGMVSGLYDGSVFEQNNINRPGTTRIYWDAYSIGLLLAMVLILGGGLWNLILGARDRAAAREAK